MDSRTRLRVALFLAVGMTTTGLALLAYGSHLIAPGSGWDVFGGAELSSIDRRFAIRGEQTPPKNIVVVKIDDTTFSELGQALALHAQGPRAGDQEPEGGRREGDRLRHPVQRANRGPDRDRPGQHVHGREPRGREPRLLDDRGERQGRGEVPGRRSRVSRTRVRGSATGTSTPTRAESSAATPYQAQGLKSFAVATVERVTGKPVHPFSNDTRLIDFSGPAGTMPSIPFSRVYPDKFPPGYFRNKIVVVGASAPSLQDVHPVSFGQNEMPGPEIQANAIETVLDGLPLTLVPRWINLAPHHRARLPVADREPAPEPLSHAHARDRGSRRLPRGHADRLQPRLGRVVRLSDGRARRLVHRRDRRALPARGVRA